MSITVSVGQFATMTHLSVKTLHHYHHVGLLEPVHIDSETGYRYYSLEQLATAQLIRRLRDLRMPVADVRDVLIAQNPRDRESLITAHIDHLEAELAQTTAAVNSLRALLNNADSPQRVHRRAEPTTPAVAITAIVDPTSIEAGGATPYTLFARLCGLVGSTKPGRRAGYTTKACFNRNLAKPLSSSPSPRHGNWGASHPSSCLLRRSP